MPLCHLATHKRTANSQIIYSFLFLHLSDGLCRLCGSTNVLWQSSTIFLANSASVSAIEQERLFKHTNVCSSQSVHRKSIQFCREVISGNVRCDGMNRVFHLCLWPRETGTGTVNGLQWNTLPNLPGWFPWGHLSWKWSTSLLRHSWLLISILLAGWAVVFNFGHLSAKMAPLYPSPVRKGKRFRALGQSVCIMYILPPLPVLPEEINF